MENSLDPKLRDYQEVENVAYYLHDGMKENEIGRTCNACENYERSGQKTLTESIASKPIHRRGVNILMSLKGTCDWIRLASGCDHWRDIMKHGHSDSSKRREFFHRKTDVTDVT
jgi:hypothetical protein